MLMSMDAGINIFEYQLKREAQQQELKISGAIGKSMVVDNMVSALTKLYGEAFDPTNAEQLDSGVKTLEKLAAAAIF